MYSYSKNCINYSIKNENEKENEEVFLYTKSKEVKAGYSLNRNIIKRNIEENFNIDKNYYNKFSFNYNYQKTIYQGEIKIKQAFNGNNIAYKENFIWGNTIKQVTKTMFHFKKNHIFSVSFNTNGQLLNQGFISVVPRIDGISQEEFVAKSANNLATKNINATSTFLINTHCDDLYVDFLIYSSEFKVNILGSLSIVEIA